VQFLSFWSDPVWRGLRIIQIVTGSTTLIILAIVLLGNSSWLVALVTAVLTNLSVAVAVVIRTFIVRAKLRHPPNS